MLAKKIILSNRISLGIKPYFWVGPIISSRRKTQNEFNDIFGDFFPSWYFGGILWFPNFVFLWALFLCSYVCLCVCISHVFFLLNSGLILFACLFYKKRERRNRVGWVERWWGTGRRWWRVRHEQNILHKISFNKNKINGIRKKYWHIRITGNVYLDQPGLMHSFWSSVHFFHVFQKLLKILYYSSICLCIPVYMYVSRKWDPLVLELQEGVNCLIRVLEIELESCVRPVHALNCWAISPVTHAAPLVTLKIHLYLTFTIVCNFSWR